MPVRKGSGNDFDTRDGGSARIRMGVENPERKRQMAAFSLVMPAATIPEMPYVLAV
ncbi:MAG TPA: hypothetical protein VFN26_04390 [Candidatus Acidoferrum sp.]|nr:hypothetical protein [Candidatus Acidoferrum sp.]